MSAAVAALYRYPVKGLSAEPLVRVALAAGTAVPHDRRFAIAHGSTSMEPAAPEWQPKTHFLMLMRYERLAQLVSRFDEASGELVIARGGKPVVHANITEPVGRAVIDQFFAAFMGESVRGAPKVVEARAEPFADRRRPALSLVNLASVHDLERVTGRPVDPLRFRANVYLDGVAAWQELGWIGGEIALGGARLRVVEAIGRCAATEVDPQTGERDLNVPRHLQRGFGHACMGVYAEVTAGGEVAVGDGLRPPG